MMYDKLYLDSSKLIFRLAVIGDKEVLLKPWCKTYYLCKFANNKNVGEGFWRTCEFLR